MCRGGTKIWLCLSRGKPGTLDIYDVAEEVALIRTPAGTGVKTYTSPIVQLSRVNTGGIPDEAPTVPS
jgi:hypothetical protein